MVFFKAYACVSSHIMGYFNTNLRIHQHILIVNQLHLVNIVRHFIVFPYDFFAS